MGAVLSAGTQPMPPCCWLLPVLPYWPHTPLCPLVQKLSPLRPSLWPLHLPPRLPGPEKIGGGGACHPQHEAPPLYGSPMRQRAKSWPPEREGQGQPVPRDEPPPLLVPDPGHSARHTQVTGWRAEASPGGWEAQLDGETSQDKMAHYFSALTSARAGDEGFMANYGFKTRNESPLQHEMGKENATKQKPSLSANGQEGCRLTGEFRTEVTKLRPERAAQREGRRAGRGHPPGAPAASPGRTPQGRAGSAHSRSQAPGSGQRAPLCRGKMHGYLGRGAGPSSARCPWAGTCHRCHQGKALQAQCHLPG